MTELESEAMEAEFDTVAGWTEEAVRGAGPGVRDPGRLPGERQRGGAALAGRPARARPGEPAARRRRRGRRPAGWLAAERGCAPVCAEPMAAAVARRRPAVRAAVGRRAGAGAAVRRRRPSTPPGASASSAPPSDKAGAAGRAAPGAAPPAAGWACSSSSPTAAHRHRCPRATSSRRRRSCVGLLRDAGFALGETARRRPRRQPAGVDRAGRRRGRRGASGGTGDDPAFRQAQENASRVGRLLAAGELRAWLVSRRCAGAAISALIAGSAKKPLQRSLCTPMVQVCPIDPTPLEPAVQVTDVRALRALAHPLRNRLLGQLRVNGPATASQLGRAIGESSGSTSYHLRQLAAYGFVEEVEGQGTARERWWRARHRMTSWQAADLLAQEGGAEVQDEMTRLQIDQHARVLDAWHTRRTRSARSGRPWPRSTTTACGCARSRRGAGRRAQRRPRALDDRAPRRPAGRGHRARLRPDRRRPAEGVAVMSAPQTVRSATRRLVGLTALRWLPVGLTTPITVLLAQARGLTLGEIGVLFTVHGVAGRGAGAARPAGWPTSSGRRPGRRRRGRCCTSRSCLLFATATSVRRLPRRHPRCSGVGPGAGLRPGRGLVRRHRPPHRPGGRRRARPGQALGGRRRQPRGRRRRRRPPPRAARRRRRARRSRCRTSGAAVLDVVFIVAVVRLLTEDRPPREGSVARGAGRRVPGRCRRR